MTDETGCEEDDPLRRRDLIGGLAATVPVLAAAGGADAAGGPAGFHPRNPGRGTADHGDWTALLARYVRLGADGIDRVNYRGWKASAADRGKLSGYLAGLQAVDPRGLTRDEQLAYWANLYNAETVRIVLEAFPVKSIRDIRPNLLTIGPWKTPTLKVAGVTLSLDQIEHAILRAGFSEPRVHYALNCASISCPNLRRKAWTGAGLEGDLSAAARAYVNHPRGAAVESGKLVVSSIYVWFKKDFGGSDGGVIRHLSTYADSDLKSALGGISAIGGDRYDWSLNQTGG